MDTNISTNDGTGVMKLSGRFDFNAHREFREALDRLVGLPATKALQVDLGEVSYLDSSALGMLLLLRDKAKQANKPVTLTGVKGSVRQVLDIANFSKMFSIS
ncbi:STAS domain-containing protein [Niveibacterium sp. 24ML]|uniref:STAS domain-containing protein n=1 Tax=Niveibacterium sp. 24ML TaxID=2985512 RepID=UPI00226EF373|nr:STAS domain-containing protein [Niveibacterium sp. 24ML]MCX9158338.1 STAS domain-containing protein [Niveibacterium sp. 24ML]